MLRAAVGEGQAELCARSVDGRKVMAQKQMWMTIVPIRICCFRTINDSHRDVRYLCVLHRYDLGPKSQAVSYLVDYFLLYVN